MKKVQAVVLGLVVLLTFGCGRDEEKVTPVITAPKCLVKEWKSVDLVYTNTLMYEYGPNKELLSVSGKIKHNFINDSIIFKYKFEYNAAGQLIKYNPMPSTSEFYNILIYNALGQITKENYYHSSAGAPWVLTNWINYEYNAANKLTKSYTGNANTTGDSHGYRIYSYPNANTVLEQGYAPVNGIQTLKYTREFLFDNQERPSRLADIVFLQDRLSNHNLISEKIIDSTGTITGQDTYAYQYNTEGYPTVRKMSLPGNPDIVIDSITYICQ